MSEIITKDFEVVQQRDVKVIETEIKLIENQVYKTTLAGVIEISKRLKEAKGLLDHGQWSNWCEENLGYSQRQAQRYIEIGEKYGDENGVFSKATISSHLSISKAYSLLKLPEEEVETFVERNNVEDMTVKELEEEVAKYKLQTDELKAKQKEIEQEAERKIRELTEPSKELEEANRLIQKQKEEIEVLKNQEGISENKVEFERLEKQLAESEKRAKEAEGKITKAEEEREKIKQEKEDAITKLKETHAKEVAAVKEKSKKAANENLYAFKVKTDNIQNEFKEIQEIISKEPEQAGKMKEALKKVLNTLAERI